jgi:hypothetical protein
MVVLARAAVHVSNFSAEMPDTLRESDEFLDAYRDELKQAYRTPEGRRRAEGTACGPRMLDELIMACQDYAADEKDAQLRPFRCFREAVERRGFAPVLSVETKFGVDIAERYRENLESLELQPPPRFIDVDDCRTRGHGKKWSRESLQRCINDADTLTSLLGMNEAEAAEELRLRRPAKKRPLPPDPAAKTVENVWRIRPCERDLWKQRIPDADFDDFERTNALFAQWCRQKAAVNYATVRKRHFSAPAVVDFTRNLVEMKRLLCASEEEIHN